MATSGPISWLKQAARNVLSNTKLGELLDINNDHQTVDKNDSLESESEKIDTVSEVAMETNDTSVADGIETNGTRANLETNEVTSHADYVEGASLTKSDKPPFEGYHLDIDMESFYSQSTKSLPRYRRDHHSFDVSQSGYVEKISAVPCSPRLVPKSSSGNQKQVVARMLRSYPQPDGSYICPIEQPIKADKPPPLPVKDRDKQPKVTIHIPRSRNYYPIQIGHHSQQQSELYKEQVQRQAFALRSAERRGKRSLSHQQSAVQLANKPCYYQPAYTRTCSHPTNSRLPHHNTVNTPTVNNYKTEHNLVYAVSDCYNNPSHQFTQPDAIGGGSYIHPPQERRASLQVAKTVYVNPYNSLRMNSDSDIPEHPETTHPAEGMDQEPKENPQGEGSSKPELYPEQRLEFPLRLRPRTQVRMTCFDVLHNANHILEFLSHKVDVLEQSLRLFTDRLSEMSDLAVTTPPCTKIDTEFCICHYTFDTAKLGHGIWKYFCDAERCNFCCHLFENLASRPGRSCHLSVLDLNLNLILAGALVISGEDNGGLVVFIEAHSQSWAHCDEDCLHDLSNFLEYISATVRNGKISVVVDSRASPESVNHLIKESIEISQKNSKGGISVASFIIEEPLLYSSRTTESGILTSQPSNVKITYSTLHDYALRLSPDKLPAQLGGTYQFDADSWIRSHACLEKKVQQHQRAFGEIFQSIHSLSLVPQTIRHAGNVIHQHKNAVDIIDRTVKQLNRSKYTEEGSRYPSDVDDINSLNILRDAEIRQLLDDLNTFMTGTLAFRDVMDSLQSLGQTGKEVSRLKVLAEQRLAKLYGCQKLWFCIEEMTKTLAMLRRAHDLIHKHRVISNNLKSAQVQFQNFNKIKQSVQKLLRQGNELLSESKVVLSQVETPIPWLEQLSSKLDIELSSLSTFLEKTELLVTDTYECYKVLDQAYDWAVESMKFVSSMNMDECLTEDGVQKLSANLASFMKSHKVIDRKTFDEASFKARGLGNKRLIDQCKIAKARCEETKQVLKVRQTTITKAKEEIEAQKARRISLEQLAADTNITPLTKLPNKSLADTGNEDIWLPQPNTPSPSQITTSRAGVNENKSNQSVQSTKPPSDDTNNNTGSRRVSKAAKLSVRSASNHTRTKSEDNSVRLVDESSYKSPLTESIDTMASSSQEDMLSPNGSQSDILSQSSSEKQTSTVTAIKSEQNAAESVIKRRSFAGFTASPNTFPQFNNLTKDTNKLADTMTKHLSQNLSELDEGLATVDDDSSCNSHAELGKSVVEKLEELGIDQSPRSAISKVKSSQRDSVITGSSDSLTSYHEDHEVLTEDSGALTKSSSSSSNSHDTHTNTNSSVQWSPIPVNTHLLQKNSSHQWQSMSDLRLTESEVRSRRTLAHIMNELIQTEKDYVLALKLVVEKYIPEMNREDVPQTLRGSRGIIFGNIEKIYDFHNHFFLKELLECDKEPFRISQCFLEHEKEFLMYALYNKNKPKSDSLMVDHGTSFFRSLQTSMGDKMDLSSYLLKPVQRMGKYALIIKQILKECPESAAEYQDLTAAQEMIKFCLQHGNDLLAMDALKDCDVNLQEQGTLLLQGELLLQKGKNKAVKRHLFLFDDLLVFAKSKRLGAATDEYTYKSSLKTVDLGLTENVGGSGTKFQIWFRKRSRENWTLQAPCSQSKNKWVSTFEKILWNQALKNRESRLTELSFMGIGSKPSLDLKQSEDNIQDRTINTELAQKAIQMKSMPESGACDSGKSPFFFARKTSATSKSKAAPSAHSHSSHSHSSSVKSSRTSPAPSNHSRSRSQSDIHSPKLLDVSQPVIRSSSPSNGLITRSNNPSPSSSSSGSVQSQGQQLAKPVTPNAVLTLLQEPLSESMV